MFDCHQHWASQFRRDAFPSIIDSSQDNVVLFGYIVYVQYIANLVIAICKIYYIPIDYDVTNCRRHEFHNLSLLRREKRENISFAKPPTHIHTHNAWMGLCLRRKIGTQVRPPNHNNNVTNNAKWVQSIYECIYTARLCSNPYSMCLIFTLDMSIVYIICTVCGERRGWWAKNCDVRLVWCHLCTV